MPARFQKIKDPMAPILRKKIDLSSALEQVEKIFAARRNQSLD
jgi:hypothetical protein